MRSPSSQSPSYASSQDQSPVEQKSLSGDGQDDSPTIPSEPEYPEKKQVIVVTIAMFLAVFLTALDRTIISTAIPSITDEFDSLGDIGWYGSAFMLTSSCFQLLLGRVYTFYTPKYVFLTLITVFEVGSAVCGAAPNSVAFIIGRAIAGVGASGIMAGTIILVVNLVPLAKRPIYLGFFGAVFGLASVVGPLLGGAFTTKVSWRWCFYINLPVGGVTMLVIFFILKPKAPARPGLNLRQQLEQLDLLGELFLLPSITCLLLALQWGGSTYAFGDGRIIALFVVFGLCFIGFILVQVFKQETATIPATVIKNRSIVSAMWFMVCFSSVMLTLIYFIPVWLQAIKGTTAVQSGIDTIPMILSMVLSSIVAGQLVGRIGYYTPLMILSSILMPIGAGLISTWDLNTGTGTWIGYQVLLGVGMGVGMQQGTMAAQTVLTGKDVPIGVSLIMFCQQLGGAIFVSIGQNVLNTHLIAGVKSVAPGLSSAKIVNTGATDLRDIVPVQDLHKILAVYNEALRQVFIVAVCGACLSCIGAFSLEWRSVKGKKGSTEKRKPNNEESSSGDAEEKV